MVVMSVTDVLSTSVLTAALLGIGMFLVRTWGSARIEEKVRWDALRRERASATAEFLATWVAPNYDPARRTDLHRLEIQQKYWELMLWLDTETFRELNRALTHDESTDHFAALARVRQTIVGSGEAPIEPAEIVRWPAQERLSPQDEEIGPKPPHERPTQEEQRSAQTDRTDAGPDDTS